MVTLLGGACMNSPKRAFPDLPGVDHEAVPDETVSPFGPNDLGTLPPDTRRALLQLVRGPYIMRERHNKLWSALESSETEIREGLGNLFLELVIDRDEGLAYACNLETDADVPKVMRRTPLTLIDTVLLLFLRDKLLRSDTGRVFVGRDEIDDHLAVYGNAAGTDGPGLARRVNASVTKLKEANVLFTTDEPDRFEISPVLRMVFDADEVAAVAAELRLLLSSGESLVEEEVG